MSARDLPVTISWFPTAFPHGPAIGDPETMRWSDFASVFEWRREGEKDGCNFIPARFKLEPDGRHVRRLGRNLLARTAVALDCETNKESGEAPPGFDGAVQRIGDAGWGAVIYTSHNHQPHAPRYRIVLPLSEEIEYELPAPVVVADHLGLRGVLDESKITTNSLFYLPSGNYGDLDHHETMAIDGDPIDAAWMREMAGAILAQRKAEQDRIAAEGRKEAEARRAAKLTAGIDPDDSLIEKLRSRFDLDSVLRDHGYDKAGNKYRHPNSSSGSFGADIKTFGGIERVFSHNGTDPLHAGNLPAWCGGVTALDAFDVVVILDFAGNRKEAMHQLAERFGLVKTAERRAVAALIFWMVRQQREQAEIETAAYAEGERQGLSRSEVNCVAQFVADTLTARKVG